MGGNFYVAHILTDIFINIYQNQINRYKTHYPNNVI